MPITDALKNSDLFAGLETKQLEKIHSLSRESSYQAGAMIFMERSDAAELFIMTEGRVALEMEVRPVSNRAAIPTAVEVVTKGECFGWSAVVEPHLYTLSARCLTRCSVIAVRGDLLRKAMDEDPSLGYQVMKRLARVISLRLQQTRLRLTSGLGLVMLRKELEASG